MSKLLDAIKFATEAHKGQVRKYTNRPYIEHPLRVMGRVIELGLNEDEACAAVLHDIVEDCDVQIITISSMFGPYVEELVNMLTNVSKKYPELNRAARKQMDRQRLSTTPQVVKIIKLVDRIDNLSEMARAESGFIRKYCDESRQLAEVLKDSSEDLYAELLKVIDKLEKT